MKTVRSILKILALALSVGTIVLFFFNFVSLKVGPETVNLLGANLVFGSNVDVAGVEASLQVSAYYTATAVLVLLTAATAVGGLFKTASQVWSMILGLITGALFTVINAAGGTKYVDVRDLGSVGTVSKVQMTTFAWVAVGLIFASAVISAVALLVNDAVIVKETGKKSVFGKSVAFLKEYKVEIKKVTWPAWATVLKNTIVVIVIALVIGAFIWLIDWGLSALFELLLS